jgi:hypothetical protein
MPSTASTRREIVPTRRQRACRIPLPPMRPAPDVFVESHMSTFEKVATDAAWVDYRVRDKMVDMQWQISQILFGTIGNSHAQVVLTQEFALLTVVFSFSSSRIAGPKWKQGILRLLAKCREPPVPSAINREGSPQRGLCSLTLPFCRGWRLEEFQKAGMGRHGNRSFCSVSKYCYR